MEISRKKRAKLAERQGQTCLYCGDPISHKEIGDAASTIDHVFPKCLGYSHSGNMVFTCRKCNAEKGERLPYPCEVFAAQVLYDTKLNEWFNPICVKAKFFTHKQQHVANENKLHADRHDYITLFQSIGLKYVNIHIVSPAEIFG